MDRQFFYDSAAEIGLTCGCNHVRLHLHKKDVATGQADEVIGRVQQCTPWGGFGTRKQMACY